MRLQPLCYESDVDESLRAVCREALCYVPIGEASQVEVQALCYESDWTLATDLHLVDLLLNEGGRAVE